MSGTPIHSPADILAQLIINLGLGTAPASALAWPVFSSQEPDLPDDCVTVYDAAAQQQGRTMIDGQRQESPGFQVRVRAAHHEDGYKKSQAIATGLDEDFYDASLLLGSTHYLVHSVSRSTGVIALGKEPNTQRVAFTFNGTVTLKQL